MFSIFAMKEQPCLQPVFIRLAHAVYLYGRRNWHGGSRLWLYGRLCGCRVYQCLSDAKGARQNTRRSLQFMLRGQIQIILLALLWWDDSAKLACWQRPWLKSREILSWNQCWKWDAGARFSISIKNWLLFARNLVTSKAAIDQFMTVSKFMLSSVNRAENFWYHHPIQIRFDDRYFTRVSKWRSAPSNYEEASNSSSCNLKTPEFGQLL